MDKKAIIFDLNGVFIQSPPLSKRIETDYGISSEIFLPVLSNIMDIVRKPGAPNMYSLWKPHLDEWDIPLSETEFLNYWFSEEKENKDMVEYANFLKKKGWIIFILSNNFKERTYYYDNHFPFLRNTFEKVYCSWQTGHIKPDEKCFTQILDTFNLDSKNCYYFDDSEKNVNVADKLGIHAHRYESLNATKKILDKQ